METDPMDGTRLAARGIPLILHGRSFRAILDFEAVELLESDFGGFDVFMDHLRDEKDEYKASRRRTVRRGIVAALIHHKPFDQDLLEFEREIRSLMEPREMATYFDVLWMAIMEAFPPIKGVDKAPKAGASRGNGSTASRRSTSVAATASSGA